MQILIVGDGKMGQTLAERLVAEDHDVVVIERDASVVSRNEDSIDALYVQGNGVSMTKLKEAGAQYADLIIAVTMSDESNMLCCLTAKLLGTRYAVARVRDPDYYDSLSFIQTRLSIDYVINPERATAHEIGRILRYPFASNVENFARGRVEMMDFTAAEGDIVIGVPLRDIAKKFKSLPQVLYCAVERNGNAIIPKGDFVITPGDIVHVASDEVTITDFFRVLGKNTLHVKNVLIAGASRIAFYLATMLVQMKIRVTIIEMNPDKARSFAEKLPEADVVQGDSTSQDMLESIGLPSFDAFVTLLNHDEDNFISALFAKTRGVRKVVTKNDFLTRTDIAKKLGLDSAVSAKTVACNTILRYVRTINNAGDTGVERMYQLMDGKAEALEFIASEHSSYLGIAIKDLPIRKNVLIATIVRNGQVMIPFGNDTIEAHDHVIIITLNKGIKDLNELISVKKP